MFSDEAKLMQSAAKVSGPSRSPSLLHGLFSCSDTLFAEVQC